MFAGTKIKIEDEDFIVPAVSLGQLRNGLAEKMKEHDKLVEDSANLFDLQILRGELIFAALKRNYPDFSEDKLFGWLDLSNVGPLWLAVLGLSGLLPGETPAATALALDAPKTDGT